MAETIQKTVIEYKIEGKMDPEDQNRIFMYGLNRVNIMNLDYELSLLDSEAREVLKNNLIFYNPIPWFYLSKGIFFYINILPTEDENVYKFRVFASSDEEFVCHVRNLIENGKIVIPAYDSQSGYDFFCNLESEFNDARRKKEDEKLIREHFTDYNFPSNFKIPYLDFSDDGRRFVCFIVEDGIPKSVELYNKSVIKVLKNNKDNLNSNLFYMYKYGLASQYLEKLIEIYENDNHFFGFGKMNRFRRRILEDPFEFLQNWYSLNYGVNYVLSNSHNFEGKYKLRTIINFENNLQIVLRRINYNLKIFKKQHPELFKDDFFVKNVLNQEVTAENIDVISQKLQKVAPDYYGKNFKNDVNKVCWLKKCIVAACKKTHFENQDYKKNVDNDKRVSWELQNEMTNTCCSEIFKCVNNEDIVPKNLIRQLFYVVEPKVSKYVINCFTDFVLYARMKFLIENINIMIFIQIFAYLSEVDQINFIIYLNLSNVVVDNEFHYIFNARNPEQFKNEFEKLKTKFPSLVAKYNEKKRGELQVLLKEVGEQEESCKSAVNKSASLKNSLLQFFNLTEYKNIDEEISKLENMLYTTKSEKLNSKLDLLKSLQQFGRHAEEEEEIAVHVNNLKEKIKTTTDFDEKTKELKNLQMDMTKHNSDILINFNETNTNLNKYRDCLNEKLSSLENKKKNIQDKSKQIDNDICNYQKKIQILEKSIKNTENTISEKNEELENIHERLENLTNDLNIAKYDENISKKKICNLTKKSSTACFATGLTNPLIAIYAMNRMILSNEVKNETENLKSLNKYDKGLQYKIDQLTNEEKNKSSECNSVCKKKVDLQKNKESIETKIKNLKEQKQIFANDLINFEKNFSSKMEKLRRKINKIGEIKAKSESR